MDVLSLARILIRRWWLIVTLAIVAGAVAYALTLVTHPRYQSTVSLQINPAASSSFLPYTTNTDQSPLTTLAASYIQVLKSRTFAQTVVQKLGVSLPPDQVARAIDAQLVPNTNILRVTVTWDNPQDAQNLAQQVATIFIQDNVQSAAGQARINDLQSSAQGIQTRIDSLQQQRDRLARSVSAGDLSSVTALNSLDQSLTSLQTSYANLLVELNRARSSLDTAAILDNASPAIAVGTIPGPQAVLLGVLAGIVISVGLILGSARVEEIVNDPEDVVALAGAPPIVAVGRVSGGSKAKKAAGEVLPPVVVREPRSIPAEAFRTLRANLRISELEQPLRMLVITSPGPEEGKTLTSTNLAVAYAQAGKRVLLVDADLRRPSVHAAFGLSNRVGLVDAVTQCARVLAPAAYQRHGSEADSAPSFELTTQTPGVFATEIPNLWVMPAGRVPSNPSEMLGSEETGYVIRSAMAHWDTVVIDTPPVGPVADALLVGRHADGILVIARSGQTRAAALRTALTSLTALGRPILGVVLNDLRPGPLSRYGAYAYYYSGYYGKHYYGGEADPPSSNGNGHLKPDDAPPLRHGAEANRG